MHYLNMYKNSLEPENHMYNEKYTMSKNIANKIVKTLILIPTTTI